MFEENIAKLREVYSKVGSSARVDDFNINKSIFVCLDMVRESVNVATEKSFSNANLAVLEDICLGSNVSLNRSTILNLVGIYTAIVMKAPGYVNRNILNAMIAVCNNKTAAHTSRDCAVQVIRSIMLHKPNDCANQTNDLILLLGKLVKMSDLSLKISCMKAISGIVSGSGSKIGDLHAEILKLVVRFSADKSAEVRCEVAEVLRHIAVHSTGFTSVPMDSLLPPAVRGLEDETAIVQDAFAAAIAAAFCEQVNAYVVNQEQAKVGAARGSTSAKTPKKSAPLSQRMSITKLTMSTKKIVDEWDFKSVVGYLHRQLTVGSNTLRTGYLTVLGYLVRTLLDSLAPEEFEWLVISTVEVLKDSPSLREMTYEEQAFLRVKFSHFFRASITASATEPQLLSFVTLLIKHICTVEANAHSDLELQLVLAEVGHAVGILGPASTALVEDVNMGVSIYLRHANFGVRAAAAQVLGNLASSVPVIATEFLRGALLNAQSQVKQLLQFDPLELSADPEPTGAPMTDAEQQQALVLLRRKNSKEQERLQRIYFFHGHTLVLSVLLKNASSLPSGLPLALVDEVYALGVELLQQDVMSVPPPVRHVVCSVVRAGSLIVASCISMGFATARVRLGDLLQTCETIFYSASIPASPSPHANQSPTLAHSTSTGSLGGVSGNASHGAKADDLVYELMCVEAALVCLSTILRFCPEALMLSSATLDAAHASHINANGGNSITAGCLPIVVSGLETAFKALRTKYQPRLKNHFRFRTLYSMVLECFTLLPPGSFPQTCQAVFVEALRAFRDSVAEGYETTLLNHYLSDQFGILSVGAGQAGACNVTAASFQSFQYEAPMSEHLFMMKLEVHATALQKKENEAFLSVFTKDVQNASVLTGTAPAVDLEEGALRTLVPCANLNARTIDASIMLLATTFYYQSAEFQEKAIQLCAHALVQFAKPGGKVGIFSSVSEEEKRRKERMHDCTMRTVLSTLCSIIQSYPASNGAENGAILPWMQSLVTILYDMLAHNSYMIRSASACALATFSEKVPAVRVVEEISLKIRKLMMSSLEKKVIDANSALDNAGYLVALSALWKSAAGMEDVQSVISTTVFDSMRKVTSSLPFRAQGLLTLSVIVHDHLMSEDTNGLADSLDLLEKVISTVDAHISNLNYNNASLTSICSDELELFAVCLQRLSNVCAALSLRLCNNGFHDADRMHSRFISLGSGVLLDRSSAAVRNETLSFFEYIVPVDVTEKYTSQLLSQLKEVVTACGEYSLGPITRALGSMLPLLKAHPKEVCQIGLDSDLFILLDYCCSRSPTSPSTSYAGIEAKRGVLRECDTGPQLSACITTVVKCIYTICTEDVKKFPDTRILHWVLMGRCIAMNTRNKGRGDNDSGDGTAQSGAPPGEGGDREDGDAFEERGEGDFGADAGSGHTSSSILVDSLNCTKFTAHCREEAIAHAPALDNCRVQLKCVAVRCVLIALEHIQNYELHSDLARARLATEKHLRGIKGKFATPEVLAMVPKYLPLFLTDTVNMACACASFLIDDKPVLMLQRESMRLMRQVVELFLFADDPDTKMTQDASCGLDPITMIVEGRLLHQFTSQLISAVRNGLTNTAAFHSSELLHDSGMLLCSLIRAGFVADKIVLRRLVKLVLVYCEQGGCISEAASASSTDPNANSTEINSSSAPGSGEALTVRAPTSLTVSADRSTVIHIAHAAVLAELFVIGTAADAQQGRFITPTVKSSVASMIMEHASVLSPLWFGTVIDATRIMWAESNFTVAKLSEGREMDALFGVKAGPESSIDRSSPTEDLLRAFNPLRGGLTYSAEAAAGISHACVRTELRDFLIDALPVSVAAYINSCAPATKANFSPKGKSRSSSNLTISALPAVPPTKVLPLFAVSHSALRATLLNSQKSSILAVNLNRLEHLMSSLLVLARKDAPIATTAVASEPHPYVIPTAEWIELITLLTNQFNVILRSAAAERAVFELSYVLSERIVGMKTGPESPQLIEALWFAVWKISALLLIAVDGCLLDSFDSAAWIAQTEFVLPSPGLSSSIISTARTGTLSIKTIAAAKVLSKLAIFKTSVAPYAAHCLTLLHVHEAVSTVNSSTAPVDGVHEQDKAVLDSITQSLVEMPCDVLPGCCIQILQNMHDWMFTQDIDGMQQNALQAQLIDHSLSTWQRVASKISNQDDIPSPFQLNALILTTTSHSLPTIALNASIRFIQMNAGAGLGAWMAGRLLPAFLLRLSFSTDPTELRVTIIKALLILFALARPEQKSALVELFLTPMCAKICENPQDSEFLLACGRGVTHLARQEPEIFRTHVPTLSENHRTVLQSVMKMALQQTSDVNSTTNSAVGSGGVTQAQQGVARQGMTINMSKYKK